MVLGIRQRGRLSSSPKLCFVTISLSFLLFVEAINGQPNYYFKASAPAVKSLPRIGRRSGGDMSGLNTEAGGPGLYGRDFSPSSSGVDGAILEMWQQQQQQDSNPSINPTGGGGGGLQLDPVSLLSGGTSSRSSSSLLAPNQMLSKALLWRKLFGEGGGGGNLYDDLDNFYRSKS